MAEGETDFGWVQAEQEIAAVLGLELELDEHLGDDWVLDVDAEMLAKCQTLIASRPRLMVLNVLLAGLRGSYHLKAVHELIVTMTTIAKAAWHEGARGYDMFDLLRNTAHAFRYGVKPADLDLVIEMCTEPSLAIEGDIEDHRRYWFESLKKLTDPRAKELCQQILENDRGRWTDWRAIDAIQLIGKRWDPTDAELLRSFEREHPESDVRQTARSVLKRHQAD